MVKAGNILIFESGKRCIIVNNTIKRGNYLSDGSYNMWDDSRLLLVDLDTGKAELHYRHNIPYEHGEPYLPMWGGVNKIVKTLKELG